MALDFVILEKDRKPISRVSLDFNLHTRLLNAATKIEADIIYRFNDYYDDAEILSSEYVPFLKELDLLMQASQADQELVGFLESLRELVFKAKEQHLLLMALAD